MHVVKQQSNEKTYSVEAGASSLGVDEFSLLSRIQTGDIHPVRSPFGEMRIPESELDRLAPASLRGASEDSSERQRFSDDSLGIKSHLGLRCNGVRPRRYEVPGHEGVFSEDEIDGYRTAYGAIASEVATAVDVKRQLRIESQFPLSGDMEIDTPEVGSWEVCEALLNLNRGEILLCRRGLEFAVIERFQEDSPYAQTKGQAEILMRGNDPNQLANEFKANAQRTVEFMASNAAARAQGIVWSQFHQQKPDEIMAAISERCRQAAANEETISQKITQSNSHGIRV